MENGNEKNVKKYLKIGLGTYEAYDGIFQREVGALVKEKTDKGEIIKILLNLLGLHCHDSFAKLPNYKKIITRLGILAKKENVDIDIFINKVKKIEKEISKAKDTMTEYDFQYVPQNVVHQIFGTTEEDSVGYIISAIDRVIGKSDDPYDTY